MCRKYADGIMLYNVGKTEEVEYQINNEVSAEIITKNSDSCYHADSILFIQPATNSLMDRSSVSSKTIGIFNTILLENQSIIDVIYNCELLTKKTIKQIPSSESNAM